MLQIVRMGSVLNIMLLLALGAQAEFVVEQATSQDDGGLELLQTRGLIELNADEAEMKENGSPAPPPHGGVDPCLTLSYARANFNECCFWDYGWGGGNQKPGHSDICKNAGWNGSPAPPPHGGVDPCLTLSYARANFRECCWWSYSWNGKAQKAGHSDICKHAGFNGLLQEEKDKMDSEEVKEEKEEGDEDEDAADVEDQKSMEETNRCPTRDDETAVRKQCKANRWGSRKCTACRGADGCTLKTTGDCAPSLLEDDEGEGRSGR